MGPEVVLVLLIAAAMTGGTKTGRKAARNFIASAHKATGWRTPRSAVHHYSGKAGAAAGRVASAGARTGRQAAGKAGQHAVRVAGRRWQQRIADGGTGPLIWRARPREPDTTGNGGDDSGKDTGTVPAGDRGPDRKPTAPGTGRATKIPPGAGPAPGSTGPDAPGTPGTANAPAGARPRRKHMSARYTINLEPPASDGEFLESCGHLGDVLKSLAEQVSDWADGLGSLNLPKSVINPLDQLSDGLTSAAAGATQAAKAFEDEFEDAREVASRGMHITGQDAA